MNENLENAFAYVAATLQHSTSRALDAGELSRWMRLCLNRQDIVAQAAEFFDNWQWKVLVGIEPSHSRFFILANLLLNFVSVRAEKGP